MSYRELRNFTEIMRSLGYSRLISVENFRKPNFELVADILYWMVKLYDPETTISDRVEFENERVEFLSGIASLLAAKARLKLNTKKLYASDGRAVQELLKLATLLYKATMMANKTTDSEAIPPPIKVQDVKTARGLASEITQTGAKLYDLLAFEATDRAARTKSLRFLDQAGAAAEGSREHAFIERSVRDLIDTTKQAVEDARKESEELEVDERNLESKIRKKAEELERTEKRLRSLESVRPQFMDEVDRLEKELAYLYDVYVEKFRNLDYLERELEKYHKAEEERRQIQQKKLEDMRKSLYREEVELLRGAGGQSGGRDADTDENDTGNKRITAPANTNKPAAAKPTNSNANTNPNARNLRAQGSMRARAEDDDSSDGAISGEEVSERGGDDSEEELSVADEPRSRAQSGARGGPSDARGNARRALESDEFGDDEDDGEDDGSDDDGDDDGSDDQF